MERRCARTGLLRASAYGQWRAARWRANFQFRAFHFRFRILFDQCILKPTRIWINASSVNSARVATTGKRPTSSGIRPEFDQVFRLGFDSTSLFDRWLGSSP
jgi:hypothetical protein